MNSRVDFLCVSSDAKVKQRCELLAQEFNYSFQKSELSQVTTWSENFDQVEFILLDVRDAGLAVAVGHISATLRLFEKSFIAVLVSEKERVYAQELKAAGAQLLFLESEFFVNSVLEFIASQIVRASYVPVKLTDFSVNSILDFHLYHLMPLNKKMVVVLPRNSTLSQEKIDKLQAVGEVFVRREEMSHYRQYFETRAAGTSDQNSQRKCRALYITYCLAHTQLIFALMDADESTSGKEGKWLYHRCEILAENLLKTMSMVGESWEVIDSAAFGEFGSVERAPAISAYAGLLSLSSSMGDPMEVMLAALLADVGMLRLPPDLTRKIRKDVGIKYLTDAEKKDYEKQVALSRQIILLKKLPVNEKVLEIVVSTHERADGRGFPEGKKDKDIPAGAMLIQFSERIDSEAMIKMGRIRIPVTLVRKNILDEEIKNPIVFTGDFLKKLKPIL